MRVDFFSTSMYNFAMYQMWEYCRIMVDFSSAVPFAFYFNGECKQRAELCNSAGLKIILTAVYVHRLKNSLGKK